VPAWILVPCLGRLRDDFNEVAPARDRASDGSIGDAAHSSSSDHTPDEISDALRGKDADSTNEVHAIDVDADLRTPGLTMEQVVQFLLARCRSGAETRLRYIIYNRRIWEASNGWRQEAYAGPNPHDKHAHFSASYDTAREASTASFHLEEIPVALTADDKKWLAAEVRAAVKELLTEDADPGARKYSLGGLVTTTEKRTDTISNEQLPNLATTMGAVALDVAAIKAAIAKTPPSA
jgi:hypothetical protein